MAYVAVDKDGRESVSLRKPGRFEMEGIIGIWKNYGIPSNISYAPFEDDIVALPKGSIEKLIGKKLTWEDEPIELKE